MSSSRIPPQDLNDIDVDVDGNDDVSLEHDGPEVAPESREVAQESHDVRASAPAVDVKEHARRTERAQDAPGSGRLAPRTNRAQDAEPKPHHYDARQRPRRTQRAQDAETVPHPHSDDMAQDASS